MVLEQEVAEVCLMLQRACFESIRKFFMTRREKFFLRVEVMCWLEIVVVYVCVDSRILDAILNRRGKV